MPFIDPDLIPDPDDLARMPRLSRRARQSLVAAGITRLSQLAALTPDELRQIKGIKSTAESHLAQARAFVEDGPIWLEPLPPVCGDGGWMFDIETDPFRPEQLWSIGWDDPDGNLSAAVVAPHRPAETWVLDERVRVHLAPSAAAAWERFAEDTAADERPLFHWTGYDSGHLRAHGPQGVVAACDARLHDLHATFARVVKIPCSSLSLKVVAPYLGFAWSGTDHYLAAYEDYRAWLQGGPPNRLARAIGYQIDDVIALRVVYRWLRRANA